MQPRRITDARAAGLSSIQVEYSSVCPMNADNTRLLLMYPDGRVALSNGYGGFIRLMASPLSANSEPRWSRRNRDLLYFVNGNELWSEQPSTGTRTLIHAFPEYIKRTIDQQHGVKGRGHSDISEDDDHVALAGRRADGIVDVFVFTISTRTKGTLFPQSKPFDSLLLAGNMALLFNGGVWALDEATGPRKIFSVNGHADTSGPYLVITNSAENPVTLPKFPNGIIRMDTTHHGEPPLGLFSLPWINSVHVSCPENRDFCIVSTYGRNEPSGKLYKVNLDGSGAELLADGINRNVDDYAATPKASVSRDGTRVVFNSNTDGRVDVWMLELTAPLPPPVVPPVVPAPVVENPWVKIDYAQQADKEFLLKPRLDGALDIYERKVKP